MGQISSLFKMKHGFRIGGRSGHQLYDIWAAMRDRCNNPRNKQFSNYGGRGIRVCSQWDDFACFVFDMGERPPGFTLDRRNNDGNYEPENCRWVDRLTQSHNSRRPRLSMDERRFVRAVYCSRPREISLHELGEIFGVSSGTIQGVVYRRRKDLPLAAEATASPHYLK